MDHVAPIPDQVDESHSSQDVPQFRLKPQNLRGFIDPLALAVAGGVPVEQRPYRRNGRRQQRVGQRACAGRVDKRSNRLDRLGCVPAYMIGSQGVALMSRLTVRSLAVQNLLSQRDVLDGLLNHHLHRAGTGQGGITHPPAKEIQFPLTTSTLILLQTDDTEQVDEELGLVYGRDAGMQAQIVDQEGRSATKSPNEHRHTDVCRPVPFRHIRCKDTQPSVKRPAQIFVWSSTSKILKTLMRSAGVKPPPLFAQTPPSRRCGGPIVRSLWAPSQESSCHSRVASPTPTNSAPGVTESTTPTRPRPECAPTPSGESPSVRSRKRHQPIGLEPWIECPVS